MPGGTPMLLVTTAAFKLPLYDFLFFFSGTLNMTNLAPNLKLGSIYSPNGGTLEHSRKLVSPSKINFVKSMTKNSVSCRFFYILLVNA